MDVLSFGLLPRPAGADPLRGLRQAISMLCNKLLLKATRLTDAFGFTYWQLDRYAFRIRALQRPQLLSSALGVCDGSVYEQLWARAQTELLNKDVPVKGYEVSEEITVAVHQVTCPYSKMSSQCLSEGIVCARRGKPARNVRP